MGARWAERTHDVLRYLIETGRMVSDRELRRDVAQHSVAHLSQLPRPTPREAAPKKKAKKKAESVPATQLHLGETQSLGLAPELTRVRQALVEGRCTPDAICDATGLSAQNVQIALFELTLRGEAELDAGGVLRLASCLK
jgi:hypothetical protein